MIGKKQKKSINRQRRRRRQRLIRHARFGHKQIFIDHSVLMRLLAGEKYVRFVRNFEESLVEANMSNGTDLRPYIGPSSLIEILGIRDAIPKLSGHAATLNTKINGESDPERAKVIAYKYFLEVCEHDERLSFNSLVRELETREKHASGGGVLLLASIKKLFLDPRHDLTKSIHETMAIDRMYGHRYFQELEYDVSASFIVDIMRNISDEQPFNQFRGVQLVFQNMGRKTNAEKLAANLGCSVTYVEKTFREILKDIRLGDNKDFVDATLIQMVTVGNHVKRKLNSVLCFTCDDENQTIRRIAAYKAVMLYIVQQLREFNKIRPVPFKIIKPRFGSLVFVAEDGRFSKTVHVSDLPDILSFYKSIGC